MKKWTKTALLTGCACCIAGAVLMFSGWASGGKAYAETYDLNAMSGSAKKEDGISAQEKIKLDDFDELQADLTIGDLNILPSGDDSCYLAWRIPSKKGETAVEYRVRDGVLSIEETSAVSDTIYINIDFTEEILSGGKQSETGVILYVPEKKVLKKIEVTMGFGDVQMNGIQAESGRLQNADGDITLFGCDMQNIKCKASAMRLRRKLPRSRWRMAMRKSKIRSFPETCRWKTPTAILTLNWVKKIWNGWKLRQRQILGRSMYRIPWRI